MSEEKKDQLGMWTEEEFKEQVETLHHEMIQEEKESQRLEEASNLVYQNGEKVKRGDVFIDLAEKKKQEEHPEDTPFGYHLYVYRINEDDTLDVCIDVNFALKMNNMPFHSETSQLVQREANLYNPIGHLFAGLDDLFEEEKSEEEKK